MIQFKEEIVERLAQNIKECVEVTKSNTVQISFPFFNFVLCVGKDGETINGRWHKLEIEGDNYKDIAEKYLYSDRVQKALYGFIENDLFTPNGKKKLSEMTIYTKID